jgi:5-methyltetrahydrofolate--homocysteine methyltransferase
VNELTLFSTQWGFRKGGGRSGRLYAKQIEDVADPALARCREQ